METAREMTLKAENITCSGCAADMEKVLRGTEGILDASVNYGSDIIHIRYDQKIIDRKHAFAAVRKLCHKVHIIAEA